MPLTPSASLVGGPTGVELKSAGQGNNVQQRFWGITVWQKLSQSLPCTTVTQDNTRLQALLTIGSC